MYVDVTDAEDTLLQFGVTLYIWGLSLVFSLEIRAGVSNDLKRDCAKLTPKNI